MICRSPFMVGGSIPAGCGVCMPCRIKRRRQLAFRLMLESSCHENSCFITLTYDEENLPTWHPPLCFFKGGNLVPRHSQTFIKDFREALMAYYRRSARGRRIGRVKIRYFLVGEYGSKTERPHYHVAMFGVSPQVANVVVPRVWRKGSFFVGSSGVNKDVGQYVAGYVTKKWNGDEWSREKLAGRRAEFSRSSNRPGIGALAVRFIGDALKSAGGRILLEQKLDVPAQLKYDGKMWPLDFYMRSKLREYLGIEEKGRASTWAYAEEMRSLLKAERVVAERRGYVPPASTLISQLSVGRRVDMEAKFKVFNSRGKL